MSHCANGKVTSATGCQFGNASVWLLNETGEVVRELPSHKRCANALGLSTSRVVLCVNGKIDNAAGYKLGRKCSGQGRQKPAKAAAGGDVPTSADIPTEGADKLEQGKGDGKAPI